MGSITPLFTRLLSLTLLLAGCTQAAGEYGFQVKDVQVRPGNQNVLAQYDQDLSLSREAVTALQNGVSLTILLELELRDSSNLMLLASEGRTMVIRYLPLNELYQLEGPEPDQIQSFPRLRHVMNSLSGFTVQFKTGPLAPGQYEFRSRIKLENSRLPAPMHLPALLSAQWKHDSEWSTWPFEIDA